MIACCSPLFVPAYEAQLICRNSDLTFVPTEEMCNVAFSHVATSVVIQPHMCVLFTLLNIRLRWVNKKGLLCIHRISIVLDVVVPQIATSAKTSSVLLMKIC